MDARDEKIISVLVKIARVCGIFPSEKPSRYLHYYQILLLILNILCSIFSAYNNTSAFFASRGILDIFINLLVSCFATMQGVSLQFLCLLFMKKFRIIYEDITMKCKITTTNQKKGIFLEIIAIHLIFFIRLFLSIWLWYPLLGIKAIMNCLFRHLNDYFCMISLMLLIHINTIIKRRFCLINTVMMESNCLQRIQKVYFDTIQLIDDFNYVFGYQILFMMGHTIALLLESLHNLLRFNSCGDISMMATFNQLFYAFTVIVIETH